jgi:RHS repeat-associated protein
LTAPDGSTNTYNYDTLNRLSSLTNSLTGQFGFGYDALSRRTQLTRPNGINTNYSYDSLSRLLSVLHQAGSTTIDGASYVYDAAGNRTSKTNQLNNVTEGYTYDPLYQLTQVAQGATTTESYSYDAVGNRLSSLSMSPYAYNSSNQLTSTPAAGYTYDNNGSTVSKTDTGGTTEYAWDFENRLAQVVLPGTGGTVTFKYDPFGRRVQKSSALGTTNNLYDGEDDNVVEEVDGNGIVLTRYTQSPETDQPLSALRSASISYYEQDGLSSVTSLSNSVGALASTYTYDSFGKLTASNGTLVNPLQYTARDFDMETGLYYYRARYYDSQVGRFLVEDPLGLRDNMNMYVYVHNNPANFDDPLGLYQLQGFPAVKQAQLARAIDEALAKLGECPSCAGADGPKIANAIENATFVYKPKLKACGDTGPLTFMRLRHTIALGINAFDPVLCCSLASTVVHEAVHSLTHFDNKAYGIEKKCFGCTDPRKP